MTATGRVSVDLTPLRTLLQRIDERWQPEQVWLFGSRARGTATTASDWDLLVVVSDSVPLSDVDDPLVGWQLQRGAGVRADVVVCRASDFADGQRTPNTLAYEAVTAGVRVR